MTEATARYHINLFWSAEDARWLTDVPDLRFRSAFGETPEASAREVQLAIQDWLASARDHGDPMPEPRYRPAIYAARAVAQDNCRKGKCPRKPLRPKPPTARLSYAGRAIA